MPSQFITTQRAKAEATASFMPKNRMRMVVVKVLGVDLAGSPHRISGICVLAFHKREERVEEEEGTEVNAEGSWDVRLWRWTACYFHSVRADDEILSVAREEKPAVVGIDAPLSFSGKPFRDCDSAVRHLCPVLPLTFSGMRKLAERGMRLASKLRALRSAEGRRVDVIEVFPRASERVFGTRMEEKLKDVLSLARNRHEYDAFLCALTARCYFEGKFQALGAKEKIIVPLV